MRLYDKYRPSRLGDVVGQDMAVAKIRRLIERGIGGRAFWISGATGTGKTTLARIIAAELAAPFFVIEYDSADDFTAREVNRLRDGMELMALGKGGRVWIINEAHGLKRSVIRQLLGILERLPEHCVVIFTTTKEGRKELFEDAIDAGPLPSRCLPIRLTNQGLATALAVYVRDAAIKEGIDGYDLAWYVKLAKRENNNGRAMFQAVESGEF